MVRTIGVEEELLLVEPESGRPLSVAASVLRDTQSTERRRQAGVPAHEGEGPAGHVTHELQQQQIETDTPPRASLDELERDLRAWRDLAIRSARESGALVVATGTSPMPVTPRRHLSERYERMGDLYGITAAEHLVSGCHVHVAVDSDEEGVAVLDRIRVWLPTLLALSANSPFWQGADSGYASFRSQALTRWPSAGPYDVFGSAEAYHALVADMVASGALLDPGMVYFDARLSASFPTIEVRVADVCLETRDAVLVAALARGLVETAAREWSDGIPAPTLPTTMIRIANWHAGRYGVEDALLDPQSARPRPAREVLDKLVDHVTPALEEAGDLDLVRRSVDRLLATGTGATRQRAVLERTGQLTDVVAELARVTAGRGD